MKSIWKYLCCVLMLCALVACQDDDLVGRQDGIGTDESVTLTVAMQFPEIRTVATRAFTSDPTDNLKDLDLFIAIFSGGNVSQTIVMPSISKAEEGATEENRIDRVEDGIVYFKVSLNQTALPAVAHLIALNDEDGSFAQRFEEAMNGPEEVAMYHSGLYTENGQDAYWQRVDLGPIVIPDDEAGKREAIAALQAKLTRVPMVRNFAAASVEVSKSAQDRFTLAGFQVINPWKRGMIVPAYVNGTQVQFAEFRKKDESDDQSYYSYVSGQGYSPRMFDLIGDETSRRIPGQRTEDLDTDSWTPEWDSEQKFFYERPITDNVNHLFVIICGSFDNHANTYYKIDLGNDDGAVFSYYHLIRNINYLITIKSVSGDGYATAAEAAAGAAFNNFSASVETRDLLNISNGTEMLYVNFTSYVTVTPGEQITFRWRYLSDLKNNTELGLFDGSDGVVWDDASRGIKVDAAGVIAEIVSGPTRASDGWYEVTLRATDDISSTTKTQTFTIYRRNGLSRTVTLIAHEKWNLSNVETYPGIWEDDTQHPAWDPDDEWTTDDNNLRYVGAEQGAPLTLFFDLPAGLPKAMFPLEFVIESDRQNIENDKQGSAPVSSGPSIFDEDDSPSKDEIRNQYIKTVQWTDYYDTENDMYRASGQVVRVRFSTITAVTADTKTTTLKIRNAKYFNDATDQFERDSRNTNIDPSPNVWDFSSSAWAETMSQYKDNPTNATIRVDGLTITPGTGQTIQTGETEDGLDYFLVSSTATTFTFTMRNTSGTDQKMTIFVTAANADASADVASVDVAVSISNNGVDADTAPNNSGFTTQSANAWVTTTAIANNGTANVTIRPAQDAPMRIYRIGYIAGSGDAASESLEP